MPRISVTRRLLRRLVFDRVKEINEHFGQPPRKSQEEMVDQIVSQVGTDLSRLVSAEGPYPLAFWNAVAEEIGGSPRKSFEAVAAELEASLDPAFDELDQNLPVSELKGDKTALRHLAGKLGLERDELEARVAETHGRTQLFKLVAEIRKAQSTPQKPKPNAVNGSSAVRVASTRVAADAVEKLNHRWMIDLMADATHLSIAAGFYDVDFVTTLLRRHASAKSIRLLFNGLGGRRLVAQRKELEELERVLSRDDRTVEVRLAFAPGLFHTKLFLVRTHTTTRAIVGSANATGAAFERNEEILVALADSTALTTYYEAAWNDARRLDDLDVSARSLVAFFRTGVLYFKPTVSLQTTLNPFRELLNLLSDEERAQLGGIALPHADQATGIGPFNLRRAVQTSVSIEKELDAAPADGGEPEAETKQDKDRRASIKPYAIETYFGYWVPSVLEEEFKKKLEKAGALKEQRWKEFRKDLQSTPKVEISKKYRDYLKAGRTALTALPNLGQHLAAVVRDPFDESAFEGFYTRVLRHVEDDDRIARLSRPFSSGPVPELWDDRPAYEDFCTTFFDYLDHVARQGHRPQVPGRLLDKLDVVESPGGEQLQAQLEEYLGEHGWTDEDWQ